jgi:hypothetical protein
VTGVQTCALPIYKEARDTFRAARGREPDAKELEALRQVWLSNEILYREGLALQLDRGDPGIRERVIFKALSMVEANLKLAPPTDAELRRWFEARRDKYDEPARYDFQEAVLATDASGPDEAAVRSFVAALNGGTQGDIKAGLRVFKGRPHANLVQSYGPDFAKALEAGPAGEWRAMATRESGREVWRAMRLEAVTPGKRLPSRSCATWCCRTGPMPRWPSAAAPRSARWAPSTRCAQRPRDEARRAAGRAAAGRVRPAGTPHGPCA